MSNDSVQHPDDPPSLRVELAEWTQRSPSRTRRQVRRHSIAGVVVGGLLLLLAVLGGIVGIVDRGFFPEVLGGLVLVVIGGLLCINGVRRLRWVPAEEPDTLVRFSAPYAFEVDDGTIGFPAYQGKSAESWPLGGTSVTVAGSGGRESVQLSRSGRQTRRYFGRALAQSPAAVVASVEARRSRGAGTTPDG